MAFQLWVNDENAGTKVLSEQEFTNLSQRQIGFEAGQPASSRNVNSGLRQANLVACALMDSLNVNGSLQSFRTSLATDIKNALDNNLAYIKLSGSQNITGNLIPKNTNSIDLGSSNKKWNIVYCDDVNYSGTNLKEKINLIDNNFSTLRTSVAYLQNDVDVLLTTEKHLVRTNYTIGNFHFTKSSLTRMGNIVMFSFEGNTTQETTNTILENFTDSRTYKFLPFDVTSENTIYLGTGGTTNPVQVNKLFPILYNSNRVIELRSGTSTGINTEWTVIGTATWFTIADLT